MMDVLAFVPRIDVGGVDVGSILRIGAGRVLEWPWSVSGDRPEVVV